MEALELSIIAEQLNKIKNTSGTNDKLTLLESFDSPSLRNILLLAYDPYTKFNVVKLDESIIKDLENEYSNEHIEYLNVTQLRDYLIEYLADRKVTGTAALVLACELYVLTPDNFKPYFLGILEKDLKIGIGEKSINKVFYGLIPTFEVPLCERFKKIKIQNLKYPLFVEPKKDGIRTIAKIWPTDGTYSVELYARSGIKFEGFTDIENELLKLAIHNELDHSIVMDGEIKDVAFQQTMANARRIHNQDTSNARYTIWDTLSLYDFETQTTTKADLQIRKEILHGYFCGLEAPHLIEIKYDIVDSFEEILSLFDYYFDVHGEEGIIVKDPESKYFYKRNRDWFKVKVTDIRTSGAEYSLVLEDLILGDSGRRFENTLGRFQYSGVAEYNGEKVPIEGFVGSGFTDAQRDDFWTRRKELIEEIFDVVAQEVTLNKSGKYSLRFPVFKCFRPDLTKKDLFND